MALNFTTKKAVRENVYVKVMLSSVSGGGKSYSALRLATGMADELEKIKGVRPDIVMLNTEGSRGNYYADEFHYDIWPDEEMEVTQEQLTPETYCDWIDHQIQKHTNHGIAPILILDGITPEWKTILAAQAKAGGQFKDWAKVDPRHNAFRDKIVLSKVHIIATARAKTQYVVENDGRKSSVRKVGMGAEIRDGFDFEYTCAFTLDQKTHTASVDKDNTHIFDSRNADLVLTEEDGRRLIRWANSSQSKHTNNPESFETVRAVAKSSKEAQEDTVNHADLPMVIGNIKSVIAEYIDNTPDEEQKSQLRKLIASTIKQYVKNDQGVSVADYRIITDINVANAVYDALVKLV